MKIKFFNRLPNPERTLFRGYYIRQNLEAVRTISIVFFVLDALFAVAPYLINLSAIQQKNIDVFQPGVIAHLLMTPIFFAGSLLLIRNFKQNTTYLALAQAVTVLFASYIIGSGMYASFVSMHNPRNTVTLYMITLMVAGIFYVFEYYESLIIAIVTTLIFSLLLHNYVNTPRELLLNQFMSVVLVIVFFSISRYVFSYRANHYLQLKTISEKNAQIEIANLVKDDILGIVAHDLRNPLSAIESIASLMQMDDNLDEDNMDNILMIKASCERAKLIINDLIEVARNDMSGEFAVDKVDLNQYLFQIVEDWHNSKTSLVKIAYYGTKQPVYAAINPDKMRRVMDNLISNAVKFSVRGDEGIEVSLRHANGAAFIDVKDFGVGIPHDLLPSIFDRFSKASRQGVHGEESTGLGLSIVKQIVSKHGGEISVSSIEKAGTTFTISLDQSIAS